MPRETRVLTSAVSVRSAPGGPPMLYGRPVVYDSLSEPIGRFRERIARGAFDRWLATSPDVYAACNHDPSLVLGRTAAGTLRLLPDRRGIAAIVRPPDTSYARDLVESIRRGDIRGMSFIFDCIADEWPKERSADDYPIRVVKSARLYEVSFVTLPAYPATSAGLSNPARSRDTIRRLLRLAELEI